MSSEKTERLVNLTLGLLASKRYLTKNEIFRTIAGYSGTAESMERMFERDKDELRSAGIIIEVGGLDPLFEDEQGYLIRSSQIQIQPHDFSKAELILMVLAANYWSQSNLDDSAKNALLKIASIDSGVVEQIDANSGQVLVQNFNHESAQVRALISAINSHRFIKFTYKSLHRTVAPIKMENTQGFWYLSAIEDNWVKKFKLIRFESSVTILTDTQPFNKDLLMQNCKFADNSEMSPQKLQAFIRIGRCNNLRKNALVKTHNGEWESLEMDFTDQEQMIRDLLWNGDDVQVIAPTALKNEIVDRLRRLVQ